MSNVYEIAVLVGSLRKASINRKVALALAELAPANLKLTIVEIGDLPLYNEDIDGDSPPAAYSTFRQQVRSSDAVLFVTPEYNRSVPAPLKNAIDVGSRPYGQSVWDGKPECGDQRFTGRRRRIWRQPQCAPVDGVSQCAVHAAAGSLSGRRRFSVRRGGQVVGVAQAVPAEIHQCVWAVGRAA